MCFFTDERNPDGKVEDKENEGSGEGDTEVALVSLDKTSSPKTFVDKIIEINVKNVNITIISDYVAELDLFYLYLKVLSFCILLNSFRGVYVIHSYKTDVLEFQLYFTLTNSN
jgi:alkyl hydroperoxide reductase subunit AhpC